MNSILTVILCACASTAVGYAQIGEIASVNSSEGMPRSGKSGYAITERGPNHRVWQRTLFETNVLGRVTSRVDSYTELGSGLCVQRAGKFVDADDTIQLAPNAAGASGTNCLHHALFAANLNTPDAVTWVLPSGDRMPTHVVGLSYYDKSSGKAVLIAETKDSFGTLVGRHEVIYSNAFDNVDADVQYFYNRGSCSQNILFRSELPSPADYQLDPNSTVIQVLTEITNAAMTRKSTRSRSGAGASGEVMDFGGLRLSRGEAFSVGTSGKPDVQGRLQVAASVQDYEGRKFLVEELPYREVVKKTQGLLKSGQSSINPRVRGKGKTVIAALGESLPVGTASQQTGKFSTVAARTSGPCFAMDYELVQAADELTLRSDTTYLVTASVWVWNVTVEGGTVVKYRAPEDISDYAAINADTIEWRTGPYRMATFTSSNDDTVGQTIPGSSGMPLSHDGGEIFHLCLLDESVASYARFAYADVAVTFQAGDTKQISNCQFMECGVAVAWSGDLILVNSLAVDCGNLAFASSVTATQITADNCGLPTGMQLYAYNSIFASCEGTDGGLGEYNAFYRCVGFGSERIGLSSSPFQAAGDGSHYLALDSLRNVVPTDYVDAGLRGLIRQKTTYPPIVYSNALISVDTTFGPQAERDRGRLDLGYHYDPLDYVFKYVRITNCAVQFAPGTAVGTFGPYGLGVLAGARLTLKGNATTPVHLVRYNLVQECGTTNWAGAGGSIVGNWQGGSPAPEVSLKFTDCSIPALDGNHFQNSWSPALFCATDSQFHGGKLYVGAPNCMLTNDILERVAVRFSQEYPDISPTVRNCLFIGGSLFIDNIDETVWTFRDNFFDETSLPTEEIPGIDADYNGYDVGYDRLYPKANSHDVVTGVQYQAGSLGNYYLPSTSSLVNAGSCTADLLGLYHYTTQTAQTKEANSVVDIGFHYVAVSGNGAPIDFDGDGVPDYLEDQNGNGSNDSGEPNWLTYNSGNGLVTGSGLRVFTPLK